MQHLHSKHSSLQRTVFCALARAVLGVVTDIFYGMISNKTHGSIDRQRRTCIAPALWTFLSLPCEMPLNVVCDTRLETTKTCEPPKAIITRTICGMWSCICGGYENSNLTTMRRSWGVLSIIVAFMYSYVPHVPCIRYQGHDRTSGHCNDRSVLEGKNVSHWTKVFSIY